MCKIIIKSIKIIIYFVLTQEFDKVDREEKFKLNLKFISIKEELWAPRQSEGWIQVQREENVQNI